MPKVVVYKPQFTIIELAAPLNGLGDTTLCGDRAIGRVAVGGEDGAFRAEELTNVLRQIPAVAVPRAVHLDSQRAGGNRLRGIPGDVPEARVGYRLEVKAGNLQVASVDVGVVQVYCSAD